jgi:NADPH:quinone reductase-like Zn-dependent oxidoreductase
VFGDLCLSGFGAFAEYVCAPVGTLARIPAGMSFPQAAAIPQAGILAWQGLYDIGALETRRTLLINGAGGGVGTFAIQLARRHDVEITAVDAPTKLDALRALGAHRVIDYTREDFTRSGRYYDLILDTRTTRSPFELARALAPGGTYATVGGRTFRLLQAALLGRVARTGGRTLRVVAQKPNKDLPQLIELFEAGRIEPVIDSRHPLSDAAAAMQRFARAEHTGKIIIEPLNLNA